jgi:hypothetical protein
MRDGGKPRVNIKGSAIDGVEEGHMLMRRPLLLSLILYVGVAAYLAYKRMTKSQQTQS